MAQYTIERHPDFYYIIRPGIDNPEDPQSNRACLYRHTADGIRWIDNIQVGTRSLLRIENYFSTEIIPQYANH